MYAPIGFMVIFDILPTSSQLEFSLIEDTLMFRQYMYYPNFGKSNDTCNTKPLIIGNISGDHYPRLLAI
jgi:hypothetical protein